MSRILQFLLVVVIVLSQARAVYSEDLLLPQTPPHLLIDVSNEKVLSSEKAHVRWAPASLTKMMTAYTVFRALELQHLKLNSPVRISEYALSQPPSKMGYPIGTVLTIEAALKIVMVKSANDISVAISEGVAGSEEQFVKLMNAHARRLGMSDTNFVNPHGLHDPAQFTSAWDMFILTKALANEFPEYASYFNINRLRIAGRVLRNHNALLRQFEGASGMKTGYVCASGFNIVVKATRKKRELLAIVFGGKSGLARNVKTARILSEGFSGVYKDSAVPLSEFDDGAQTSNVPQDITREICPRKYAAQVKPASRPLEAPTSDDFDSIDTQIWIDRKKAKEEKEAALRTPVPKKRPDYVPPKTVVVASAGASVSVAPKGTETGSKAKQLSLREKARLYLVPHKKVRPDERLALGGATGPNPLGIKNTNGGPYKPPIPVPEKRPALDLAESEE